MNSQNSTVFRGGRDLRKRADSCTVIRVFEDRSCLVEFSNGRRMRLAFQTCPSCKKERPSANFTGATCVECRSDAPQLQERFLSQRAGGDRYYRSKRYAALRQATPPWVDIGELEKLKAEARAKTSETGIQHHVDHIWPLVHEAFCGLHVPWNLRVVPYSQNIAKHNKPPLDYLQQITSN